MASTKLEFKTHADLKNVIGQDLINDDNIAIIELVKNGIDAGAKSVTIDFSSYDSAIYICDDGSGMSANDIRDKWLNIAYSEKKEAQQKNRVLAGNKGVGRFACDRLGKSLEIYTQTRERKLIKLTVDWTDFENKKDHRTTIQDIKVNLDEISNKELDTAIKSRIPTRGTLLVIKDLRQEWGRERLLQLKRQLERFVNPIAAFDKNGVSIELSADAEIDNDQKEEPHNQINVKVENQIFSKLKFNTTYISATISDDGKTVITELHHDGERVYRLVEENADFKLLPNTNVVVHYMNAYKKAYFKRQTGLNLVEFGSVFLFVNGYRVPPYGDRSNDWLQLDNRKAQGTARYLGNRDLLGLINISDSKGAFRIASNREGVTRTPPFLQLVDKSGGFFVSVLARLERFVVDGLNWDSVPDHIRKKLRSDVIPGDDGMPEREIYDESTDLKHRRIALDVIKLVGASPANTKEFEFSPEILDALSREREEQVTSILEKFTAFGDSIGHDVKLALGRLQSEFVRQKEALALARQTASRKDHQVARLKGVAREISKRKDELQKQVKTQQTELLFSRLSSSSDQEQLMLLHHQSGIYANTAKNFLDRALAQFKDGGDASKAFDFVEKALISTRKIIAVSSFATKANFKLKTETITADIATFIKEYLENVARDTSAQNLIVSVDLETDTPFVVRFKPIDVAIVFDNLASNSTRARAKRFDVTIRKTSENELSVLVSDDGPGISPEVVPASKIFDRGVTTTNGSGLGLYHVQQTVKQLNGDISINTETQKGFGVLIRLNK